MAKQRVNRKLQLQDAAARVNWTGKAWMRVGRSQSEVAVGPEEHLKIKQCRATEQKEWLLYWSNSGSLSK